MSKHLGVFKRVRDCFSKDVSTMIYNALILHLLDYCNIVISIGDASIVSRLQHYYIIGQVVLYSSGTGSLRHLKWHSVDVRIKFHTGVFKCHRKECPKYLYDSI